jgi:hypothetical protein
MTVRRALLTLIALTMVVHMATRVAMGVSRCYPVHCAGGPRW